MPLNLPIILTWVRIAMIPLVVSVYYVPEHVLPTAVRDAVATGMFIFAALTDWLDGWLARRLNRPPRSAPSWTPWPTNSWSARRCSCC